MKFGKQLEISANPEWRDNYVQYKRLKRLIKRVAFEVEKQQNKAKKLQQKMEHGEVQLQVVDETHPLLKAVVDEVQDAKDQFWEVLDANLKIVNDFYVGKVVTLTRSVGEFEAMLEDEKTPTGHVHTRSRTHSQGTELDCSSDLRGMRAFWWVEADRFCCLCADCSRPWVCCAAGDLRYAGGSAHVCADQPLGFPKDRQEGADSRWNFVR
ncbi:unnamed protein product [Phytophthora lilii]|uniref:Unnamed protein product n=1 Tax=Phytophthora lilii TaxID=2077276 RepID=A0A9W6WRJ4_9STRA|nr:unnamed protein product [Phytophthora lilii]